MGALYVFEPWPDAVDTAGLCGPLTPKDATFTEERNGAMELETKHPIDAAGKWSHLVPGNLVSAMVPMHTLPEFNHANWSAYASVLRRTAIKSDATPAQRAVYQGTASSLRIATLQPGQIVYQNPTYISSRTRIVWSHGSGYISTDALESTYTEVVQADYANYIEYIIPPPRCRMQLFRIYAVSRSLTGVTAKARHVSYDTLGNVTSISGGEIDLGAATGAITGNMRDMRPENHVTIRYAIDGSTETRDFAAMQRVSPVEAVLSPEGIAAAWARNVVRDNWSTYLLDMVGRNTGFRIEYGVNMLGVDYSEDESNVVAKILPVGQTSKGKPLTIPDGAYTVDGDTIGVTNGLVESPRGDLYPIPHIGVMDMGSEIKAAGTTSGQLNAAYVKLIRAALRKFLKERCDYPEISVSVNFLKLGDTAEYAHLRDLERVLIHDMVPVRHPRLGIDITTTVNKVVWDCLLERYKSIDLGNLKRNFARTRIAPWQVPGLASLRAYVDTVTSAM